MHRDGRGLSSGGRGLCNERGGVHLAPLSLRDRDAIITREGLIFRVLGYTHPQEGYICDLEYAPEGVYRSEDSRAYRTEGERVYYKFYGDEGWGFIQRGFPRYMVFLQPLGRRVLGVRGTDIGGVKRPEEALRKLLECGSKDELTGALERLMEIVIEGSAISAQEFGVFGSILHGFYNPRLSDLDMVVYGRGTLERLRELLRELYMGGGSRLSNEFEKDESVAGKNWRFRNITPKEFVWHQRRKMIYGIFHDENAGRDIKFEFEPVKLFSEIKNEYNELRRVKWDGWVRALLRVRDDSEGPYMPSVYHVEPLEILEGPEVDDVEKVVSYLEEFRMQAWRDEVIYVEGNLEWVETRGGEYHQITLTYGPRYYEQVIKLAEMGASQTD
ncbi:MAG: nucleotidyltransferase domain-containing protein [Candidatus Bathyarchaeia archaeon]